MPCVLLDPPEPPDDPEPPDEPLPPEPPPDGSLPLPPLVPPDDDVFVPELTGDCAEEGFEDLDNALGAPQFNSKKENRNTRNKSARLRFIISGNPCDQPR